MPGLAGDGGIVDGLFIGLIVEPDMASRGAGRIVEGLPALEDDNGVVRSVNKKDRPRRDIGRGASGGKIPQIRPGLNARQRDADGLYEPFEKWRK